jgi:hypothetical protein
LYAWFMWISLIAALAISQSNISVSLDENPDDSLS